MSPMVDGDRVGNRGRGALSVVLAVAAGLAQAVAIAWPWGGQALWWLQVFSLAVLVVLLLRVSAGGQRTVWRGAWLTWCFALAWNVGAIWWLYISMHTYGGLAAPLSAIAVFLLAAFLALFHAAAVAGWLWLIQAPALKGRPLAAVAFAALWMLAALARGQWLTGFPWGLGGYAHVEGPLAGYAAWIGIYGIEAAAALIAAMTALLLGRGDAGLAGGVLGRAMLVMPLAGLLAVPMALRLAAPGFTQSAGVMQVELLQGNIPQDEKFVAGTGIVDSLTWYGKALNESSASLVVAPETALPVLPADLPAGYWDALVRRFGSPAAGGTPQAALIGMPLGDIERGYTNSVAGFAPGAAGAYRYDKHHLVPFGEFIPRLFRWFVDMMRIPLGDFARGGLGQPSFDWQGQRLAPNVCYEDLFGEELATRFSDPARSPTAFVNISNIAWFGDSVAIDQHLNISRMRALEFERPMLRATNTGATAIIDHRGQVTHLLPRLTRGVLAGSFEGRQGQTPYAQWVARWGLWPLWLGGLLLGLVLPLLRRRG